MANNFFNDSNKAYSENLNDGILVGNAFDWTVSIGLPTDTEDVFPSSNDVVMAKVADVSATPNSNLSIGSTITNSSNSSQVYRLTVYPNFNRFGGFKSISLTADSGVTFYIANKGASTPIANNLDYTDLSNVPELKVLKEYDIVITIPKNKSVSELIFIFQSSSADVSGSISQANVTNLVSDLEGKANSTHTHTTAQSTNSSALTNIGTSANAAQSTINGAIDDAVGGLNTNIGNLIQVKELVGEINNVASGESKATSFTIPALPSGYSRVFIPVTTGWGNLSSVQFIENNLIVYFLNTSSSTHSISFRGYLVYFPSSWLIQ